MSRLGPLPMTPQARWDDGAVCVWGWDGLSAASAGWLSSNGGMARGFGPRSFSLSGVMVALSRLEMTIDGRRIVASCLRLRPGDATPWLAQLAFVDDTALSPTVQWFRAMATLAEAVVDAGRVRPQLERVPPPHARMVAPLVHARWRVVDGGDLDAAVAELAIAAPAAALPVDLPAPAPVGAQAPLVPSRLTITREVLDAMVDGLARSRLHSSGWKPQLNGVRSHEAQAVRAVYSALSKPDPLVKGGSAPYEEALVGLAHEMEREARRAAGEPIVSVRLRLVLPDDADDAWPIGLEVVDDDGRWCTAADVADGTPLAVSIAGSDDHLPLLRTAVARVALALGADLPVLAPLAADSSDGRVLLDIDEVAELLTAAPAVLARLDVELLGPESLVKAAPSVRGQASPTQGGERRAGLDAAAIVQWDVQVTADDRSLSARLTDEEIERATAAGVALMQVGGRWVQLDGAQLQRARKAVDKHRGAHSEVDALTLLRLAAEAGEAGDDAVGTIVDVSGSDDESRTADLWLGDLLRGLPDEELTETAEPPGFVGELRHYQRRGLSWLQFLARVGLGGVLADDMGLGKTATALAHLLTRPGPHLVVCPLSVVRNWQRESARFAPGLDVRIHHGADRHRGEQVEEGLGDADIVITTYGLVARDAQHLAEIPWTTMVLDEAQMVKNPTTRAAKGVRHVPAVQKIALTGTPVENHLTELWAILDAVNPGMLGSQRRFRDRYARPIEREADDDVAERLRRLTQPFVLRRTKADKRLLPDLPDKVEQIEWAELSKEQQALYKGVVDQLLAEADRESGMKRRGLVLAALTRLKQICNHPVHALGDGSRLAGRSGKLDRFDELVDALLDSGEQALVFTQFREMGDLLQRHLAERIDLRAPFLHGGVTRQRRDTMVDEFQTGQGSPLLLVSLKAGGTGLNLTAATRVIHYDRWWNPAVEDQASDRAWRIGQTETVFVHKLVCTGTVEEKIAALIDQKKALAASVVGTGEAWLSELSTDELRDLVMLELGS